MGVGVYSRGRPGHHCHDDITYEQKSCKFILCYGPDPEYLKEKSGAWEMGQRRGNQF